MANELFGFNTTQKAELIKYIDSRLSTLTAADIAVADGGGVFTGTNVETVLAELEAALP